MTEKQENKKRKVVRTLKNVIPNLKFKKNTEEKNTQKAKKIAKTENSGYTGGYKPAEAVKIIYAGIIEPEETTE